MANPFTSGPFNCCSCPEPPDYDAGVDGPLPKYTSKCGCPSVSIQCESEQKVATLCGFPEFTNGADIVASIPPKKYLEKHSEETFERTRYLCCADGLGGYERRIQIEIRNVEPRTSVGVFNPAISCDIPTYTTSNGLQSRTDYNCSGTAFPRSPGAVTSNNGLFTVISTTRKENIDSDESYFHSSSNCTGVEDERSWSEVETLTVGTEDTEAAALARATPTASNECGSLYELRTTDFSFIHRTVTYTATASNLVVGVEYEGCVRIQRREAYSGTLPPGANTDWEDVEPDTIAPFVATSSQEQVALDVELPIEQGYEYRAASAHVWPTSAGCSCPTDYVAPPPP